MEGALSRSEGTMEESGHPVVNHPEDTADVGVQSAVFAAALFGPHVSFEIPVAVDAPVVMSQFVDQDFFRRGGGLVFSAEVCAEGIQVFGILTGDAGGLRVEPMLECVF